jgi:hypothetical protein
MARAEDDDLLVEFMVQLMEIDGDMPAERLVHEIKGSIKLMSPEGEEQPIGSLTAYLVNIAALMEEGIYLLAPHDMREQHLAGTVNRIFNFEEYEFTPAMLKKAGFPDSDSIQWHLHMFGLYLEPQHRGRRRGVRALRLLRWYTQRPGLLATARAFPREPSEHGSPTGAAMAALARYYLSEKALGFRQLGHLDQGWLIANWSSFQTASPHPPDADAGGDEVTLEGCPGLNEPTWG